MKHSVFYDMVDEPTYQTATKKYINTKILELEQHAVKDGIKNDKKKQKQIIKELAHLEDCLHNIHYCIPPYTITIVLKSGNLTTVYTAFLTLDNHIEIFEALLYLSIWLNSYKSSWEVLDARYELEHEGVKYPIINFKDDISTENILESRPSLAMDAKAYSQYVKNHNWIITAMDVISSSRVTRDETEDERRRQSISKSIDTNLRRVKEILRSKLYRDFHKRTEEIHSKFLKICLCDDQIVDIGPYHDEDLPF